MCFPAKETLRVKFYLMQTQIHLNQNTICYIPKNKETQARESQTHEKKQTYITTHKISIVTIIKIKSTYNPFKID